MTQNEAQDALKVAKVAIINARDTRQFHARVSERGDPQRDRDLTDAREQVARAMIPLRSYLGKAIYFEPTEHREKLNDRVRLASKALQSERRKLWKMLQSPKQRPELMQPNTIYSNKPRAVLTDA